MNDTQKKTDAEVAKKVGEILEQLEKEGYCPRKFFALGRYLVCGG